MRIGITHKLFLAILTASITAVACLVITMQWKLDRGFLKYVNSIEQSGLTRLASQLESGYETEKSWDYLSRDQSRWHRTALESMHLPPGVDIHRHPPENTAPGPPPGAHPENPPPNPFFGDNGPPPTFLPPHLARVIDQRLFLLDANRKVLISRLKVAEDSPATELRNNGRIVGYLGLLPSTNVSDPFQQRFLREQKHTFVIVAAVVVVLATGLSLLLAAQLIKPVKALAKATHSLAAGDHTVRVPVSSRDELGRLAEDFNALAVTLDKNDQARRQWVADISHELRTPLAILRGEIEAFLDGVRQPNQETIASLHGEVLRLGRLVEDLYQLSLTDLCAMSYRKSDQDCANILLDAIDSFDAEFAAKDILLKAEVPLDAHKLVFADDERLHQLFGNLLENSLKYTTPGGTLAIRLEYRDNNVIIHFDDSAPAVPPDSLVLLFDRLYRVEGSRNRALGGAGLGLSICRNIVEAHGGSIEACHSSLGGLCIRIVFPLSGGSA